MTFAAWCSVQPWWPFVQPMLHSGLYVRIHVPGRMPDAVIRADRRALASRFAVLRHPPSGGELCVEECPDGVASWRIVLVGAQSDMAPERLIPIEIGVPGGDDVWN
jgi:hypothetical protein